MSNSIAYPLAFLHFVKCSIAKLICSRPVAVLITAITGNRIRYRGGIVVDTSGNQVSGYLKCMLFWRMYEKAEAQSILKYVTSQYDVVELGSSIGVVGCIAGKVKGDRRMLCVEVNQDLIPIIERNLKLNRIGNYKIRNAAIGVGDKPLWFTPGMHSTHGQVGSSHSEKSIKIETVPLSRLLEQEAIGDFVLICDIEGSEIDIVLNDPGCLKRCKLIVLEAHSVCRNNKLYSPMDIKQVILNEGFDCIEERNVNFVFVRSS